MGLGQEGLGLAHRDAPRHVSVRRVFVGGWKKTVKLGGDGLCG